MDIDEIRRINLCRLEDEFGAKAVAESAGMSIAQFYNLRDGAKDSRTGKRRGMRKETAWRFEDGCRKPRGWLDVDNSAQPVEIAEIQPPIPYLDRLTAEEMHFLHLIRSVPDAYRPRLLIAFRGIVEASPLSNNKGDGGTRRNTGG